MIRIIQKLTMGILCTLSGLLVAQNAYWQIQPEEIKKGETDIELTQYLFTTLDTLLLKSILWKSPAEERTELTQSNHTIIVPDPSGGFKRFKIVSYEMMEPELSERYPGIKTFKGIGVDRPSETIRLDWTSFGFHAKVRTKEGIYFIDPYNRSTKTDYVVYYKSWAIHRPMECHVTETDKIKDEPAQVFGLGSRYGDCNFRRYRLAQATTGEYSNYHGATSAAQSNLVLSAVTTVINRINDVYERDMTVRLILIGNTDAVFYYNPSTDPYTNNNGSTMLGQNQTTLDNVIGTANYDIGHVFSTGGGGVATLRSPCNASNKARGVTGLPNPIGDPFSIDYVAHEMGHQFGANHTQNNNCQRNNATAMEPGSASTIMGYAGICNPNVQNQSDDYMHAVSLQEISAFVAGNGNACATQLSLNNSAPVIEAISATQIIPAGTAFVLTANVTDPQNDPLSYCWEQFNNQTGFPMPPSATSTGGPMFRSILPREEPERYFPNLPAIIAGNTPTWEVVPTVTRAMNFRLTVRDNNPTAGCLTNQLITISTTTAAGPFVVNAPNTAVSITRNAYYRVIWSVGNTHLPPVNCGAVDIFLSTNGGSTFDFVLAEGVENNGFYFVQMPNITSSQCRIMVKCSEGAFLDVSNTNFSLVAGSSGFSLGALPALTEACVPAAIEVEIQSSSLNGFSGPITLSMTDLPAGATAQFSANPITPGQSATVTLSGLENGGFGAKTYTLQGNSNAGNVSIPLEFIVNAGGASATLQLPENAETEVSPVPTFQCTISGTSLTNELEVSLDPDFNAIVFSDSFTGNSFTLPIALEGSTTYYWRIRPIAFCGPGAFSAIFSFTTSACEEYISTNVPIGISASGTPTITSTLNITSSGIVQDVNVIQLIGTHTFIRDLIVTLISPIGTRVTLFSQICTSQDNFNVQFDDQASLTTLPCPPTTGLFYRPAQPLSTFNGEQMAGPWTLEIQDTANDDGGSLQGWGLSICAEDQTFLPVEWLGFNVRADQDRKHILLDWSVQTDGKGDRFEIQRSIGSPSSFEVIHTLTDPRTIASTMAFQWIDHTAPSGQDLFYRIRQIDQDGTSSFSAIRSAKLQLSADWQLYPNPTSTDIRLDGLITGSASMSIMHLDGRTVQHLSNINTQNPIYVQDLPSGLYWIQISDEVKSQIFKLIIAR
jgi:subtilisin-like proprotein convertase family protein